MLNTDDSNLSSIWSVSPSSPSSCGGCSGGGRDVAGSKDSPTWNSISASLGLDLAGSILTCLSQPMLPAQRRVRFMPSALRPVARSSGVSSVNRLSKSSGPIETLDTGDAGTVFSMLCVTLPPYDVEYTSGGNASVRSMQSAWPDSLLVLGLVSVVKV